MSERRLTPRAEAALAAMNPAQRQVTMVALEIHDALITTLDTTLNFYVDLRPNGRELDPDERAATRAQVETSALCLRDADDVRDLVRQLADEEDIDLRPTISALRSLQRSLILALSDWENRRLAVMSGQEVATLIKPILTSWKRMD